MTEKLHKALEALAPHMGEGSQIFIREGGNYHKFRIEGGQVAHRETHSCSHVEKGRGALKSPGERPGIRGGNEERKVTVRTGSQRAGALPCP